MTWTAGIRNCPLGRGFTLVELAVTMAITSALMLALGSAMMIASRAMPDARGPVAAAVNTAQAAEQLANELQYAVSIDSRSATMIEFTVADRDANDVPETIRYEWASSAGAPLTRQYNGGPVVEVLPDVRDFALSYSLKTISTEIPQGNESSETLLTSYSALWHSENLSITSSARYGQYFRPTLPADAVSWKVTRIRIYGRMYGYWYGESRVQLQTATSGNRPSGVVLEEKTLMETGLLGDYTEQEFAFHGVSGLSPTQGLCIVVKWIYDYVACQLLGYHEGASTENSFLVTSGDSGVTWTAPSGYGLKYAVYGTVTTSGTPQVQTTYHLERVDVRLRSGGDSQATVQTAVRLSNRPEVTQ